MTDFRERYKRVGIGREDMATNRALRSQRRDEARRDARTEHFSLRRDIEDMHDEDENVAKEETNEKDERVDHKEEESKKKADEDLDEGIKKRLLQLEKWREERNRRRLLEKKRAKPAFKVGVVHHRVYSPPLIKDPVPPPPAKLCKSKEVQHHNSDPPSKRVTRATEKRLAIKAMSNKQKQEELRNKRKEKEKHQPKLKNKEEKQVPLVPNDFQFKAPSGLTAIPIFGRQALETTKSNSQVPSSSDISSTVSEFGKSTSDGSDSVFYKDHSIILSKSSSRHSNLSTSNLHPCDSSTKNINNSLNDSSVEQITLKLSMDDQEILEEQECISKVNSSKANDIKLKRHSELTKSPATRRSSRVIIGKSKSIKTPPKSASFTIQNQEIQTNNSTFKNISLTEDISISKQKKIKSPEKIPSKVNKIVTEKESVEEMETDTLEVEQMTESIHGKTDHNDLVNSVSNVSTFKNANLIKDTSDLKQKITKSFGRRRSSKVFVSTQDNKTETETEVEKMETDILEVKQMFESNHPQTAHNDSINSVSNVSTSKNDSFTVDTSISKRKKTGSPRKRKSLKAFAPTQSNETKVEEEIVKEMETDTLEVEQMVESNHEQTPHNNDLINPKSKKQTTKRRSTRKISEKFKIIEDSSFMAEEQKILEDQENIDHNVKNLIDYSLSDLSKIPSLRKQKSMSFGEDLQDQSLMKFSPRHSMRPQAVNSPKENILSATSTTESLKEIEENQCIEKLSLKNDISTHNNSEPTNQLIFEKNDSLNQSLNISLPKDSTSDKPPAFFSPYVVASRGKDRVRKEVQRRRFSQPLSAEIPTKETVMQTLNISIEEEERTAQYYKFILDKEIERLNELCDTWNAIKEDPSTPEDTRYEIQAAVGQTQLLINKKFERFRGLALDCETGKGEMLVTCKDLQGFWDMMYVEIKDCDNRFNKLEGKKAKNWVVEEIEEEKKEKIPKKKPIAAKKPTAKKKPVAAKSSLRAHIMAARKKKMEGKDNDIDVEMKEIPTIEQNHRLEEVAEEASKNVGTPPKNIRRSTSTPKSTNKWQSLLKKVQLSQTRKSTTSPLIVMKLSQMCKTPEIHLDDSIVYINSDRTPAKSILKSAKEELIGSVAKSANKVFFKEQPMEFREIESNNEQICLEDVNEFKEPIERRLDFENDSFNSSNLEDKDKKEEVNKSNNSITLSPFNTTAKDKSLKIPEIVINGTSPLISISPLSLQDKREKSPIKKNTKTKKMISFKDNSKSTPRSLRSRKLSAPGTPRPRSKNSKQDKDENLDVSLDNSENSMTSTPQQVQSRQLYMNEEGIICEKIIPAKDTPRTITLKRANSETIRRSTRSKINSEVETLSTPKTKRSNFVEITIDSQNTPVKTNINKSRKSSLTLRQKTPKLELDTELTENNANKNIQEEGTPKSKKRTAKTFKTPKSNSLDLEENVKETATVKLKRSKSLNTAKVDESTDESLKITKITRTRRTNSRVDETKSIIEESRMTPSLKRKNSKKPQENLESDEQETDDDRNNRMKVSRTPSIKRRDSKRYTVPVENDEHQTDEINRNKVLTPNTRRKSSRISKCISET